MKEQKYYGMAPRSRDNIGHDVILLYAHWSILNLNVEEEDKQPNKARYHKPHTVYHSMHARWLEILVNHQVA